MSDPVTLTPSELRAIGPSLFRLIERLYPICRSITGNGVRESLRILQELVPLEMFEIESGTPVFDWTVPREWNVRSAWIKDSKGRVIVDFKDNNLHLLNYSLPLHQTMSRAELLPHLFSLPDQPDLIPYKTSYYADNWGFCVRDNLVQSLADEIYEVYIDTTLEPGRLSYGELLIPGQSDQEVLFSTHICHPSLANDNLSGVSVMAHLAARLLTRNNRFSYRFLWIPGTIGAITWLAHNQDVVPRVKYGLVASLLGDEGAFTYKRTRGLTRELDFLVPQVLEASGYLHKVIDFSPYGYDERQFCSPGFDLEMGSLTRSVFASFPEYHTSADNLDFIRERSLVESLDVYARIVERTERGRFYKSLFPNCEPQLGKRGLYDALGGKRNDTNQTMAMLWVLNTADGKQSLQTCAEKSGLPYEALLSVADRLVQAGLIVEV